jgi:hypothetical protein
VVYGFIESKRCPPELDREFGSERLPRWVPTSKVCCRHSSRTRVTHFSSRSAPWVFAPVREHTWTCDSSSRFAECGTCLRGACSFSWVVWWQLAARSVTLQAFTDGRRRTPATADVPCLEHTGAAPRCVKPLGMRHDGGRRRVPNLIE